MIESTLPHTDFDMPQNMKEALAEHLRFNRLIGVTDVPQLNQAVRDRDAADIINVCETRQTKYLGRIADQIAARRQQGQAGIVLIAGPSSSGKTTTCKRLANQLLINFIRPKMISLDDYFVNRINTPLDESGDYDYESLYALDIEQFKSDLKKLLNGEEINLPTYCFETGERTNTPRPLRLEKDEVLIVEGIHGLNPELTEGIDDHHLFKIFASAIPTLLNSEDTLIPSRDNRLLRRMVRDHKYRHVSAEGTLKRWGSVRRGEEKWILPFCKNADVTFNTSLLYELGAIRVYVEPLLKEVPDNSSVFDEARRLLRFIDQFSPIPSDKVPPMSLLREFVGGSSFKY